MTELSASTINMSKSNIADGTLHCCDCRHYKSLFAVGWRLAASLWLCWTRAGCLPRWCRWWRSSCPSLWCPAQRRQSPCGGRSPGPGTSLRATRLTLRGATASPWSVWWRSTWWRPTWSQSYQPSTATRTSGPSTPSTPPRRSKWDPIWVFFLQILWLVINLISLVSLLTSIALVAVTGSQ